MGPTAALERLLLRAEVEDWLLHEADLLDEDRLEEWLELLHPELRYVVPLRLNVASTGTEDTSVTRGGADVCWFDEDKETLRKRVEQIRSGSHWAEEPRSRITHLVANIRVLHASPEEITVGSRFVIHRNRVADETDFFVGRRTDVLARTADGLRIRCRTVLLDQNVLLAKNLTIFF